MSILKYSAFACCLGALLTVCVPRAKATDWDKKTKITVGQPISIGGTVLPPGNYVLRLLDSLSNRNIVQVLNAKETKVEATIFAIPDLRSEPTGKTALKFWETPAGQPPALRSWYYPGDEYGQEFLRPVTVPAVVAQAPAPPPPAAAPAPAPPQTAEATPPAPPAPTHAQSAPAEQAPEAPPTPAPAPLPKTASSYPMVGALGLLSLGAALGTRLALKRGV